MTRDAEMKVAEGKTNWFQAKELVRLFCCTSSIPCVIKVHDYPSMLAKIVWAIVLLTGTAACMWHCSLLVTFYLSNPVQTGVTVVNQRTIEFPSVTICNMNPLKASKLKGTRFEKLVKLDEVLAKSSKSGGGMRTTTAAARLRRDVDDESEFEIEKQRRVKRDVPTLQPTDTTTVEQTSVDTDSTTTSEQPEESTDDYYYYYDDPAMWDSSLSETAGNASLISDLGANSLPPATSDGSDTVLLKSNLSYLIAYENDVLGLMKASQTPDFADVLAVIHPTQKEIQDYGHQESNMILQCTFDSFDCSRWKWYMIENQKYGRCYSFNPGVESKIIKTNRFGSQYGLKLTLNPEASEYVGLFSPSVGIRVVIHPSNIRPYPDQTGIDAALGFSTQIGIRKNVISRLDGYTDCVTPDNNPTVQNSSSDNSTDKPKKIYIYSMLSCLDDCVQNAMKTKCNCWDKFDSEGQNTSLCSFFNQTQSKCRDTVYDEYDHEKLDCSRCSQSCQDEFYSTTISASTWPSPKYQPILMRKLNNTVNDTDQLVHVHVYFEELNYQSIDQTSAYGLDKMFADLGGILGLYIGLSVCGIFEILELLVVVVQMIGIIMKRNSISSSKIELSTEIHTAT